MRDEWERVAAPITALHYRLTAPPTPSPPPLQSVATAKFECECVFIYGPNYGLSAIFARLSSGVGGVGGGGGCACMCLCVCGSKKKKEKVKGPIIMFTSADGKSQGCNDQ